MEKILHLWISHPAGRWFARHSGYPYVVSEGLKNLRFALAQPRCPNSYWDSRPLQVNVQNEGEGLRGRDKGGNGIGP